VRCAILLLVGRRNVQVEPEKTPRDRAEDLIRLLVPDWRPTPRQGLWAIRIGIVLGLLVAIGYSYGVTLWDWIKLLIVPAAIAGAGLWFNQQQRDREVQIADQRAQTDQEIADQHRQDDTLQAYLDGMAQLLTDEKRPLHRAQVGDSLSTVARARTLTVLARLDSERKGNVVQFLYESGLLAKNRVVVDLRGANLSQGNLRGVDLGEAKLTEADLTEAVLRYAILIQANLRDADLSYANLSHARLWDVDLSRADLSGANLWKANLSGIEGSTTYEQLEQQSYSLKGATMPDGQKYEDWLKDKDHEENRKSE
jgi:hypothetical protein